MVGGESYWIASTDGPERPRLEGDLAVDTAVVGAGITGLTTAVLLAREGVRVAVLEADRVGTGVTGHTTGKVTSGHGLVYSRLERELDASAARAYAASQTAGVELVFRLADELAISCDLERTSNFLYAESPDEVGRLEDEVAAAARAGLPARFERRPDTPFRSVAAARLDQQGQLHARRYVLGLAAALPGGAVFEHTRVLGLEVSRGDQVLTTETGSVRARSVVLATNAPITMKGALFARAHAWRAYAIGARADPSPVDGMWINLGAPARSYRTTPLDDGGRLVLAVGQGHRVGQEDDSRRCYDALREALRSWLPDAEVAYGWSTQDQYAVDGLPFIGRVGDEGSGLYVATGFGGWGLSTGSLAGLLLTDAIVRRANDWASLYDPGRRTLTRSPVALLRANANVARRLVGGRLRRRPGAIDRVARGAGEVVDVGGEHVAVHRSESGDVHAVSAVCTHMGCLVEWNRAESTWDCPCHGSRFGVDGAVLEGPAVRDLSPAALETRAPAA